MLTRDRILRKIKFVCKSQCKHYNFHKTIDANSRLGNIKFTSSNNVNVVQCIGSHFSCTFMKLISISWKFTRNSLLSKMFAWVLSAFVLIPSKIHPSSLSNHFPSPHHSTAYIMITNQNCAELNSNCETPFINLKHIYIYISLCLVSIAKNQS